MDERYGRRKFSKMYAELVTLRLAIRSHDPEATEEAWDKCEEWIDAVFAPTGVDTAMPERRGGE